MKISIIVPTYKENENLPKLFNEIAKSLKRKKLDWQIVIVDDNSQDGTIETVKKYSKKYPIELIVRKDKKGLASACIDGFEKAKGDVFLVMDADLQHPPDKIPELINSIKNGADIAIGSRYAEGGSIGKFSRGRKIVSDGASLLANLLFSEIKNIKDKESGFFAFKKKVIKNIKLKPKGYKILLEILVLGDYKNVLEVGYQFGTRHSGKSKLGVTTIFSYLSHLISLLWTSGKLTKLINFCFVGLIGVGVNLGILYGLTSIGLYYLISGIISIEASVLANFFLNRAWTFKEESKEVDLTQALIRDHTTRFIGIVINYACLFIFTAQFKMYYLFSMLIGIIISTIWNFIGNSKWVWKK